MIEDINSNIIILSLVFIIAGIMHFIVPKTYMKIMPPSIPKPKLMVLISGAAEIIFGALFLFPSTRGLASIGLIVLLIAVFPANIHMAQRMRKKNHPYTWLAYLRLPLQFVLIYWVYYSVSY